MRRPIRGRKADGGLDSTPVGVFGVFGVFGVTGQTLMAQPMPVRELEIARQRLGPTSLLFADLHAFRVLEMIERPALLIGADILYRFTNASPDFGNSRMVFGRLKWRPKA